MGKEAPPFILYRWVSDSEQAGEQGNQHGADHGNTRSGHELYDGEIVVKREFSEYRKTLPNRTA